METEITFAKNFTFNIQVITGTTLLDSNVIKTLKNF